ncbi:pre-rRNA-processing protein TSR2, conserved region [Actinidia rufa]|uniref:Pre-rRNA-processing protein TSR2, conserved region n=1 Tax=Actinidia rufa TaxID=165716 RepID=A0A7J0EW82_9ERIC|nr:pre-rRNA-processing protein TSR2, conserved region [Actinidia rufa]
MDPEKARQISAESAAQLQEGISLLLSRWSALQMAVENEWGGHDSRLKSHQLAADIFSWLTQSKEPLYIDDLENMLDEFMLSLNTEIADGSIEEIAEKVMIMLEECLEGNYKSIQILKETNPPRGAVPHIRQGLQDWIVWSGSGPGCRGDGGCTKRELRWGWGEEVALVSVKKSFGSVAWPWRVRQDLGGVQCVGCVKVVRLESGWGPWWHLEVILLWGEESGDGMEGSNEIVAIITSEYCPKGTSDDDDESVGEEDSSEMVVDAPQSQSNPNHKDMVVDEPRQNVAAEVDDGWTVVASKRNKGRRN